MGLFYPLQDPKILFNAVTLTSSYGDNFILNVNLRGYAEAALFVKYTPAVNGSSIQIEYRGSPDGLDSITPVYYQETQSNVAGGTDTLTLLEHTFVGASASTEYDFFFLLPPNAVFGEYAIKETSSGAFGTATVTLLTGGR